VLKSPLKGGEIECIRLIVDGVCTNMLVWPEYDALAEFDQ
jgi:hypothetical protein